jgi:hypothetical protein
MTEVTFIAVKHASGVVSRLQVVTAAGAGCFSPDAAAAHGFTLEGSRWVRQLTDAMLDAEVRRAVYPHGTGEVISWRRVSAADFAGDGEGTYKAARRDDGKQLTIDMAAARAIHRAKLRHARTPKLASLDVAYIRADEMGDTTAKSTIAAQKQTLRDVTADPAIEAAKTPEDLKAVWPDCLKD